MKKLTRCIIVGVIGLGLLAAACKGPTDPDYGPGGWGTQSANFPGWGSVEFTPGAGGCLSVNSCFPQMTSHMSGNNVSNHDFPDYRQGAFANWLIRDKNHKNAHDTNAPNEGTYNATQYMSDWRDQGGQYWPCLNAADRQAGLEALGK